MRDPSFARDPGGSRADEKEDTRSQKQPHASADIISERRANEPGTVLVQQTYGFHRPPTRWRIKVAGPCSTRTGNRISLCLVKPKTTRCSVLSRQMQMGQHRPCPMLAVNNHPHAKMPCTRVVTCSAARVRVRCHHASDHSTPDLFADAASGPWCILGMLSTIMVPSRPATSDFARWSSSYLVCTVAALLAVMRKGYTPTRSECIC